MSYVALSLRVKSAARQIRSNINQDKGANVA